MRTNLRLMISGLTVLLLICTHTAWAAPGDCSNESCGAPSIGIANALFGDLLAALNEAKCNISNPSIWPEDYANEALTNGLIDYDFVIVGAGTAGSVVASRLSEDPNVNVLLLEAGGDPPVESEIFSLSGALHRTEYFYTKYSEPNSKCCQAMKDGKCYWPHGKMIGGSGGINGNIFLPGNQENFDRWQQLGNIGWSWQDVKHIYELATTDMGNETYPTGGLTLNLFEQLEQDRELSEIVFNSSSELGIPRLQNVAGGTTIGYTRDIPATIEQGRRMSTGKTYLGKVARLRANLHVIKNAFVTKIRINSKRKVQGVDFILRGTHQMHVNASKEVIVSAGSIQSPALLQLSRIGPRKLLHPLGIPVVKDLPVGDNLHDHGMMPLLLKFGVEMDSPSSQSVNQNTFDYLFNQKGPLATTYSIMGFINSNEASTSPYPDLHLVSHTILPKGDVSSFKFLGVKDEIVQATAAQVENHSIMQIMASLLKPKSRGSIRIRTSSPLDPPSIYNNFATHPDDKATLLRYVRYVQRLIHTETFRQYHLELVHVPISECDLLAYDTDDYWLCYIKYFYLSAWHPVGTCKMGHVSDNRAVVDPRLRVHGVRGLRVVDASIMPEITSGNTNGPTVMIAEKGAIMIKEDWLQNEVV